MSWGSDALGVTEDTFDMIKAATSGINTSTGVAGIHMSDLVSLVPVDTPFFNSTPRHPAPVGALFAVWQALLNVNSTQPNGGIQKQQAAPLIEIENQYLYSNYAVVGAGGTVSWDALAQGQNYATVLAVDTLQAVNQQLIFLDRHQLNGQSFKTCATVPTPALTKHPSGGSIATTITVKVKVAIRSGLNYYYGGSSLPGTVATVKTSAATSSVTAKVTAVKTAAAYDWFVSFTTGTVYYYYTTTPWNVVTITKKITAAQTIPTTYAGLYKAGGAGPAVPTGTRATFQSYWQNGLVSSILGDFSASPDQLGVSGQVANLVAPGTGTAQGSYYSSLTGGALTVSGAAITQIDEMNRRIYDKYQLTPTRMLMGSQSINDVADALLDNPQAVTWLVPTDAQGRARMVAGGAVAVYLNKTVNGRPITIELQPNLPPGKIVSVVDEVPFPGANITTVLSVETLYDFFRFDYGANRVLTTTTNSGGGPRYDFEVRTSQAFINKASPVFGVLDNIAPGLS